MGGAGAVYAAQAQEVVGLLSEVVDPLFVEEPTHPHDVAAHAAIAAAIAPTPVAVGESIPNRVVFKNFMQAGAVQVCQIDPTRLGGVGEALSCAMMAKHFKLRVIPHVGDMGQLSQHLCLVYHIALGHELEFLEYIPHLREYFVSPAVVKGGRYAVPRAAGASTEIVSAEMAEHIQADTKILEGATELGDK